MAKKKKRKKRARSKKSMRLKVKTATMHSIVQITFFALGLLVILSFSRRGLLLVLVNDFLVTMFSWTTVFLPFVFLTFGMLVSKFKGPLSQPNTLVGSLLFFLSAAALTRAGLVGIYMWEGIEALITGIGAFIVYAGTILVGLVVLFNTSLDQVWTVVMGLFQHYGIRKTTVPRNLSRLGTKTFRGESSSSLKVIGGDPDDAKVSVRQKSNPKIIQAKQEKFTKKDNIPLEAKLVSNVQGEDKVWKYPSPSILSDTGGGKADRGDIKGNAAIVEQTLESFGITARVVEVNLGPAVTQYALEVALGTKLSKITSLERDLALALAAPTGTIRIEAPIPGRSLIGIELPNKMAEFVPFKKMIRSDNLKNAKNKLTVAMGLDVSGKPVVADISKMPHVLIAGQTGSGKSVCINTMLSSLLFRASPSEVKFILVDPKRVELTGYNNIPHLLAPVIVEPEKVVSALRWTMGEMDRRYKLFAQAGVRNIGSYNEMSGFQALPHIVIVIDELADIMLFAPSEVEDSITRIAQMSRATGIHMILATQRPSVDVITGLIKANIPSRIAFAVSSQIDSRVIIDGQGAEKLLGKGDMLYLASNKAKPSRIQGAFVSDPDIKSIVTYIKNQGIQPQYTDEVTSMPKPGSTKIPGMSGEVDDFFKQAVEIVCQNDKASASLLQRRLSIGYARAARILDQLESAGVVTPPNGSKPRDVLIQGPESLFATSPSENAA